jgi:hypothetical protein
VSHLFYSRILLDRSLNIQDVDCHQEHVLDPQTGEGRQQFYLPRIQGQAYDRSLLRLQVRHYEFIFPNGRPVSCDFEQAEGHDFRVHDRC